jgi:hypothetical protein
MESTAQVETIQVTINGLKKEVVKKDPYDLAHDIFHGIARTQALNSIVMGNFNGAEGTGLIGEETLNYLLWQIETNLEQLEGLATEVMYLGR